MNTFSLFYATEQFFLRILDFFSHWYIGGIGAIRRRMSATFRLLERSLALRLTFKHFFEPLYGDYSLVGRIVGPIFRVLRMFFAAALYLFLFACFLIFALAWALLPPFLIINITYPFL
jgi:hypothetical protein